MKNFKGIIIAVAVAAITVVSCSGPSKKEVKEAPAGDVKMVELTVTGMTCTGCEQTIQAGISKVNGVKNVKAIHTAGKTFVTFTGPASDTSLFRSAVTENGYGITAISFMAVPDSLK